jgi:hypothetical protein
MLSKIINPGSKETSQFVSPQELNIQQQKEEFKKKDTEIKMKQQLAQQQMQMQQMQKQMAQMQNNNTVQTNQYDTSSSIGNILNSQIFNEPVAANAKPLPKTITANQLKVERPDIRAPDQVKDILSRIHNVQSTIKSPKARGNTETQDETSSQNDRLVSETTLSENNPRRRMAKKKKGGIIID